MGRHPAGACPGCGVPTPKNVGPLSWENLPFDSHKSPQPDPDEQQAMFHSHRCWVEWRKRMGLEEPIGV